MISARLSTVLGNSVTTDGRGYVLVGNFYDYYIKMVSLSDGKDLGHLVRKGDKVLGKPSMVQWCNATSSWLVAHKVNDMWHISSIQFQ